MADTIIPGTTRENQTVWETFGSGIIRSETHGGIPTIVLNGSGITSGIITLIEDANVLLSGIFGAVDTLEPLTEAGNALLSGIESAVDGLEGLGATSNVLLSGLQLLVDDIEPLLIAISGFVDGVEPLLQGITDINTSISGFVDALEPSLDTANTTLSGIEILATTGNSILSGIESGVDGLEGLSTTANATLSGIESGVDGLEGLATTANATLSGIEAAIGSTANSGVIITDPDGATQARVLDNSTIPSGTLETLVVTVDTKLLTSTVLASGTVSGLVESADIDVSSQLGFYNNALFILSSVATTVDILANTDDGGIFATVKAALTVAAGEAVYYDLKGYEVTMRIKPTDTGDFIVQLVRNR